MILKTRVSPNPKLLLSDWLIVYPVPGVGGWRVHLEEEYKPLAWVQVNTWGCRGQTHARCQVPKVAEQLTAKTDRVHFWCKRYPKTLPLGCCVLMLM